MLEKIKMENENVKLTKLWIERFVIGLGLCPFAHFPFNNNKIYYSISESLKMKECVKDLMDMIHKMKEVDVEKISNSFVLYPASLSFDFMLNLKDKVDKEMIELSIDEAFQIVVFHPHFQFGDELFHASGNFTNRSPLPMMHVLREDEVARAIELTDDVDAIPLRNKKILEDLNIRNISEVFEDDFMEKTKQYI